MKGFRAVQGDGHQARCSLVFSEKICSHHFPPSLAAIGRWIKNKIIFAISDRIRTATVLQDREGVLTVYFFIIIGMLNIWDRMFIQINTF